MDTSNTTSNTTAKRDDRRAETPVPPPVRDVPRPFSTAVRGHAFAAPPPGAQKLSPGAPLKLCREPANPADPYAVAVWTVAGDAEQWRIGYLDRLVAARLAGELDRGTVRRAWVQGWLAEPAGRWQRPMIRIGEAASGTSPDQRAGDPPRPRGRHAQGPGRVWGRQPGVRRRIIGTSVA